MKTTADTSLEIHYPWTDLPVLARPRHAWLTGTDAGLRS